MKSGIKKILLSTLALVLTVMLIAGLAEVVVMSGGPTVAASVLASAGDPEPSGGDGGGGSSTPSGGGGSSTSGGGSSYSGGTKTTVKKTSSPKKSNPIKVKKKTVSVSAATLAAGSKSISRKTAMAITKAKGDLTYKKLKGNSKIKINKNTGKITLKKGLAKGTYKVRLKVRAAGTSKYKPKSYIFTETIKVVGAENTLSATGKTVEVDRDKVAEADVAIKKASAISVSDPKGAVSYSKMSGNDAVKVNGSTGDITVGKGLAEGTYEVKVKVTAAGNSVYNAKAVTASITVVVKAAETQEP
jgi:hypothetical protein